MDDFELASALTGATRAEKSNTKPTQTTTISGIATSDSNNGLVSVNLGGDSVTYDGKQDITISTSVSVKKGDHVRITLVGADGTAKDAMVTDVVGGGDRAQDEIDSANQTAASAQDTAQSVKNYFFSDTTGAHITTTENDATKGPNTLITPDKVSIRDGEDELMSIDPNEINLGKNSSSAKINLCDKKIQFTSELANNNTARRTYITGDASLNNNSIYLRLKDIANDNGTFDAYIGIEDGADDAPNCVSLKGSTLHISDTTNHDIICNTSKLLHVLSETELYNNESTAFNASVTLSETAANFTDLEIFYKSNDGYYGSVKVHNPDGKNVSLLSATPKSASNQAYFKQRTVHISGAAINTLVVGSGWGIGEEMLTNGSTVSFIGTDVIAITRVVGWRY